MILEMAIDAEFKRPKKNLKTQNTRKNSSFRLNKLLNSLPRNSRVFEKSSRISRKNSRQLLKTQESANSELVNNTCKLSKNKPEVTCFLGLILRTCISFLFQPSLFQAAAVRCGISTMRRRRRVKVENSREFC